MNPLPSMNPQPLLPLSNPFPMAQSPTSSELAAAIPPVANAGNVNAGEAVAVVNAVEAIAPTATAATPERPSSTPWLLQQPLHKLRGGLLMGLGYLLSPLCWWNDLIINLPVAYGVGYLVSLVAPQWFGIGAIAGYWLSNLVGIVLMQWGLGDMVQGQAQRRQPTRDLLMGLATSTVYTVVIVAVVQLKWLDLSAILPADLFATSPLNSVGSESVLSLPQIGDWFQHLLGWL